MSVSSFEHVNGPSDISAPVSIECRCVLAHTGATHAVAHTRKERRAQRAANARPSLAALPNRTAPHEVHDAQQSDGSHERYDETRDGEAALIDGRHTEDGAQEPTPEERADDSDHDV